MYYHSERQPAHSFLLRVEQKTQNLFFRAGFLTLTVTGAFLYVFQINNVTASGYTIGQLEKQISKLESVNRQVDVEVAEVQSIARLTTELAYRGYVPIDKIEYASIGASVVAKR